MTKKSEGQIILEVTKRDVVGKAVKKLRRQKLLPGNIFGEKFASTAITVDAHTFSLAHKAAGETQVIHLKLEKDDIPVIIHKVQHHPVSDSLLHVDFHKVDLTKKIQTEVPLKHIGESPAIEGKKGDLITDSDTILIEALPDNIPTEIEIDISTLATPGDEIKVGDLKISGDFTIITEADKTLLRIIEHKEEELEAQIPEEVAEEGEGVTPTEGEATEGEAEEQKTEESATEEKSNEKSDEKEKKE